MLKLLDLIAASCMIAQFCSIEKLDDCPSQQNHNRGGFSVNRQKRANLQMLETVFHCMIKRSQN